MAAQRCSDCGLNYPLGYNLCQVCNLPLSRMNADVHEDWQAQVAARLSEIHDPPTREQKVELWRLESALRLGYEVETAESIAADTEVDLNLLRVLVEKKSVPLELAARIA